MITRFHIENFKSLANFDLPPDGRELSPFTCLIGLNGAGKSTLLQALDFVAHLATGTASEWIGSREWKKLDVVTNLGSKKPTIIFTITVRNPQGEAIEWSARYNAVHLKCSTETILRDQKPILKLEDNKLWISGGTSGEERRFDKVPFEYHGSVISTLKLNDADPSIAELKEMLETLKSLELLSPHQMRRRGKAAEDIGTGGEKLSGFLSSFTTHQKPELIDELRQFYPSFQNLNVNTLRYGWKNLRVWEKHVRNGVDALHLNDGLLRVIAILAQAQTSHSFLLFDEIENGINPTVAEKLMDFLVALGRKGKQVIVTTHSPVILNYLEDAVAKESVFLLYKTSSGHTRACRYFDQPETDRKLTALGPGEVFVDTNLVEMVDRLQENQPHENGTRSE